MTIVATVKPVVPPLIALTLLALTSTLAAGELATEASPFLRGLGNSAVTWRGLSSATLADAQRADLPLFILLGPSDLATCSLPESSIVADGGIARVLTSSFTAVAIDCRERPDACDVYSAAVALLQPEVERDGRALWIVATPEGWPFAAGGASGEPGAAAGLTAQLESLTKRYASERSDTRLRAGATAAALRQGQLSPAALRPLSRDVVTRALQGLRDATGPIGRLDVPLHGGLRLLLAEAPSDANARRMLTRTLDAIVSERLPACRDTTAEQAQRLRALVLGYSLTGSASWRLAAEALATRVLTTRDVSGPRGVTSDERVFALDRGLVLGALALSGANLSRPADIVAARAIAADVLRRLGPAGVLHRFASEDTPHGSALLADYAFLAEGLLDLYAATSDARWRDEALGLVDTALVRFADPAGGLFDSDDVFVARPRNAFDGPLPSASGVMAGVLLRLAAATGQTRYSDLARNTVTSFLGELQRAPRGVEMLATVAREWTTQPVTTATPEPTFDSHGGPVSGTLALSSASVHAGAALEARIALSIASGYSINAHVPGSRDLYGLSVSVVGEGLRAGTARYPPAANVPRRFSKETVLGHVDGALVALPLTVLRTTPVGEMRVRLRIGFQACTERACQPPDSLVLDAPLTVTR
jgi:uncharacterized protein YyaL (SSP411 family)